MKEKFKALFSGEPGWSLGFGATAVGFPLLAILMGLLGDAIGSENMAQVNVYFFYPLTGVLGVVLGVLAIRGARKLRQSIDDPRLRGAEVLAIIGMVLLPAYLLFIA